MRGRLPHSIPSHPPTLPPAPVWPALLWLAGLAALLARSAWTHAGFAWLRLRHFIPAAEALRERVAALAARLGLRRRVRVLASERLRTPAAFGWLRPGVVVPGDFTARFAPAQQDVMLAHELAHLAARDPLWQLLADLAAAALWWHPLVWVARRQHHIAGELAADDASLALPDGPVVLAECLLALGHEAADYPRAALGMAGFRSQLGRRVERLVALPPGDWQPAGKLRSFAQTTAALVLFAALALLPGCAANRTATEAPTRTIATWWQAKRAPVGDDVRSLTSADSGQRTAVSQKRVTSLPTNDQPVLIQGRVRFSGTPPTEWAIGTPPQFADSLKAKANELDQQRNVMLAAAQQTAAEYKRLIGKTVDSSIGIPEREQHKRAAETKLLELQKLETTIGEFDRDTRLTLSTMQKNARLMTRNHLRSPDGGLADVLVYVKRGLEGQTFAPPTNTHLIRIQRYEYEPYITAVQAGQPIRWESDMDLNFHPTPTNRANREFNRTLDPGRPVEASFTAPEFFLRTKDDVHPWLFGYVSVLPHPFFAVTDAEGRFRFPRPLPPGKYTLAAVHRRAGESTQEINLRQPLPAGQPLDVQFQLVAKEVSAAAPALPGPFTNGPLKSLNLRSYTPTASLTREELLERKARVEVQITEAERTSPPTHPKLIGLRKQLESIEEALKQAAPKPGASLQPAPVGDDVRRLTSPQAPDAKPKTPAASATPAAAPATVLAVGDHLQVEMNFSRAGSNQTLAFRGLVASAGYVPIPRVTRAVVVAGKTIDEAQRMICDQLVKDGYEAPRVTLTKVSPLLPSPPGSVFNLQSNGYQIRPGDEVVVSVWGREDLCTRAKVQPDGGLQLPLVGSVQIVGKSVTAARDAVKAAYQPAHLAEAHVAVLLVRLAEPIPKGISFPTYSTLPDLVVLHPPTLEKLARLRLPEVQYDGLRLPEVLKLLAADAKKHDPDMQGLGFETQWGLFTGGAFTPPQPSQPTTRTNASGSVYTITSNRPLPRSRIRLNFDMDTVLVNIPSALRDISALDALDAIVKAADYPIRFTIETNRVIFWQRPTNEPSPTPKPPAPKPGASLQPVPVGDAVRRLTSPQTPDAKPQTPPASQRLVTSSPTVVKPVAASSLGAGKILRKLEEIVLPEIHFDGVTLAEVMKRLDADARKFDPEKKGLNFLINDVAPPATLLDASGNPVPVAQPVPLSEGLIRISTTLRNLTLRQVLDVICKTAELPTQFSVEEYAIVFIPRGPGNAAYFSRIFRVNPNTFIQGLQGVVGNPVLGVGVGQGTSPVGAGTSTGPVRATVPATVPATQRTAAEANALVRQFFQSAGVASLGATNSSTQVFFNPENGLIIARGTTNDLRVIEQAIQKVQPPPAPAKK